MARFLVAFVGAVMAAALVVTAIWAWFDLADWALSGRRPDVLHWAARSLAIAAAAGAQIIVISFVIGQIYRLRRFHDMVRLGAALVCCSAAICAAALGLAAQG